MCAELYSFWKHVRTCQSFPILTSQKYRKYLYYAWDIQIIFDCSNDTKATKICICLSVPCASIKSTIVLSKGFAYRKYIGPCSLITLWQGKTYDLSKKQKQMSMYLILCTSAQAFTASIFTDSFRGKVKCQKKNFMYNQFIPIRLLNKQIKSYIFVKLCAGQSITYEIPFINIIKLRMKGQKPKKTSICHLHLYRL